jgi:hypothetical protein
VKSTTEAGVPKSLISMLAEKHRTLEIALDQLLLDGTAQDTSRLHETLSVLKRHYEEEEGLLTLLAGRSIPLAQKDDGPA